MRRFGRDGDADREPPERGGPGTGRRLTPDQHQVVRELNGLVMDGMHELPIDESTLGLLQVGLPYLTQRECSEQAIIAGQTAARLGYLARAAEYAMFDAAQELDDGLLDELANRLDDADESPSATEDVVAELAAELALAEPIDPGGGQDGPLWSLPGAEGVLRVELRDRFSRALTRPQDVSIGELQQTWMYGFFLRGLQECFEDEDMTG